MRLTVFSLPVLATIFACGPGQPAETDADPGATTGTTTGTDGTTAPATTSTTSPPATTDAPTTSTAPTTTAATTEDPGTTTGPVDPTDATTTTTTTTTGTTDEPGTTDETTTGGAPDVAFAAQFWAGGLDHLTVRMADLKDDRCVSIEFARPGGVPRPGLVLPDDWWYQGAVIHQGAADCLDFMAPLGQGVGAESVAGEASWDVQPFCPPVIDHLDLVLDFPQDLPWVPASEVVAAGIIAVDGC